MAAKGGYSLRNVTYTADNVTSSSSVTASAPDDTQVKVCVSEPPVVFHCARCRRPVGDSLSWAGSEDEQNQIWLKRITDNVVLSSEPFLSRTKQEVGCLVVNLSCRGCSSVLGRVFTSTPRSLDHKRSLFCFDVQSIDCYVVGSSAQTMIENPEESPVTVEYREAVELQIAQIKALALSLGQRLAEIEAELRDKGQ